MKKKIIQKLFSGTMAVMFACTSVAAQAHEVDIDEELEGGIDYETYLTWGIDDYADRTKSIYKLEYPEQTETIDLIVDSITANEGFVAMFSELGKDAFQVIEDSLRDALQPSVSPLDSTDELYFSMYDITPITQVSSMYNAAAAATMALTGSGKSGYTQFSVKSILDADSSTNNTIYKINNLLRSKIPDENGYGVRTRAFVPINGRADNLINCISNALILDTVPVIQFDNADINGGSSGMRYLVATTVDTLTESVTFFDPDTSQQSIRYFSYDELDELLTDAGVIWVSSYSQNRGNDGLAVVMADYPNNSYFSNTGVVCTCHNSSSNDCEWNIPCDCKYYDGAIQCYGFARYVFFNTKGRSESNSQESGYKINVNKSLTALTAQSYLIGLSTGTHLRVKTSSNVYHSLSVVSKSSNGITLAQANYGGSCKVTYRTYTWSQYVSAFPTLVFYVE